MMNSRTKFSIRTFGCRCNQADSATIREGLCRRSMCSSDTHRDADLIVINTCTVTHRTDRQVRQAVRRLHRENPAARLVVTGCYAERDPETLAAIEGVSLVVGNAERDRLPEILSEEAPDLSGGIIHAPLDPGVEYVLQPAGETGGKTRPLVKLQDGCDARCSYCIVPHVRGPGRSARPENVLAEIRSLIRHGFQEIVLTGVHLGAYGYKLGGRTRLIDLLRQIAEIPYLGRIRLSSIEPMQFDRAIIDLAAGNPVFARHFHIPMQSASDRVLRRMRRPYGAARFQQLLRYIRKNLPDVGLGTDVLVGFPGETDEDFSETCEFIRESPLTYLHIFPFSPREGTDAWSLPGRISAPIMKSRMNRLLKISRQKNLSFRRRFLGRTLPAITLSKEENQGALVVLTDNYIHAKIPGHSVPANRLIEIKIEEVLPESTIAGLAK